MNYLAEMFVRELPWQEPQELFTAFADVPHAHLLGGAGAVRSGWAYIVADPVDVVIAKPGAGREFLRSVQAIHKTRNKESGDRNTTALPPFCAGLVGFIGYEALAELEPSLELPPSPYDLPSAHFGVYDGCIAFDQSNKRCSIIGRRQEICDSLQRRLAGPVRIGAGDPGCASAFSSNFTREEYEKCVAEIIEAIAAGDIFQANIAQTLRAEFALPANAYALFKQIARNSDAPFASVLQYAQGAVISNSPERFFQTRSTLSGEWEIVSEPIKGTAPRFLDQQKDQMSARDLEANEKERAENVMIADLIRNDLSKICRDHGIFEDQICAVRSFRKVHHLVSTIRGVLHENPDFEKIFASLFPCGSITGAPKIEAMHKIAGAEARGRGVYCGSIGFIDDSGCADFSVAIRTMILDKIGTALFIPVGGGITLRSDPAAEYQETLLKARAAIEAFGLKEGDLQ